MNSGRRTGPRSGRASEEKPKLRPESHSTDSTIEGRLAGPDPFSIVVFPFLKTSGPLRLGALEFRSTTDTAGLPIEKAAAVAEIGQMLFLQDDLRLQSATYAITPHVDLTYGVPESAIALRAIGDVVAYCYASPHPSSGDPFLSSEHASLVLFSPAQFSVHVLTQDFHVTPVAKRVLVPDKRGEVSGYAGVYNFRHHFWVAPGSRLYGPLPHLVLNQSQDLAELSPDRSERIDTRLLLDLLREPEAERNVRVVTALRWFAASNSESNDEAASIVDLAIAFEALLGLPEGEKTERIVDAIGLLLGRVPRLDVWAHQFYQARSQIVHEGRPRELRFVAKDAMKDRTGQTQLGLLAYGRQIFQMCMATLLTGLELARKAGLQDKFVTNQERFERICSFAADAATGEELLLKLAPLLDAAERYRFNPEGSLRIATILGAVRATASAALRLGGIEKEAREVLEAVVAAPREANSFGELRALGAAADLLPQGPVLEDSAAMAAARKIVHLAWGLVFMHYFWLKEAQAQG